MDVVEPDVFKGRELERGEDGRHLLDLLKTTESPISI
mgnify:FL=1